MKSCREVEPLLAPYADGDVPPSERAHVADHIEACSACRSDLMAQRAARDLLHDRRDSLRDPAPPALRARCEAAMSRHTAPAVVRPTPFLRRMPLAAAATILLALATVFGLGLNNKVQALALQMTLDHLTCARMNAGAGPADPAEASTRWASNFGWPLTVPPSSHSAGLELRTVRRCVVTDGRVAHLIYRWRGETLSVFVLPSKAIDRAAEVVRFGHDSVMWSQNGRTYVVLARGARRSDLPSVVQYVRSNVY